MDDNYANGDQPAQTEAAPQAGICIEICILESGEVYVSSKPEVNTENGEQVASLDEALAKVRELAESGGEDNFDAGFGKGQAAPTYIREGE